MSTNLSEVQARTGQLLSASGVSTLGAEAERAVAQVQAAFTIAQKFPRDINESVKKVKDICKVLEVAADAEYIYKRGGKAVQGPNIRIAEIIASQWRNLEYATVEIMRGPGESLCEAYCVDLETNVKARTQFVVPHRRDTRDDGGGNSGKALTSDRDIYEMIANMGSRRVREQIFRVIPQFVVDAAIEQCRATVKAQDAKEPLKDRVKKLVPAFEAIGVTPKMLAAWLKCAPEEMIEQQFQQLRPIYRSLRDHQARIEDFFETPKADGAGVQASPVQGSEPQKDADDEIPHEDPNKDKGPEKTQADLKAEEQAKKPAANQKPEALPKDEKPRDPPAEGPPGYDEIVAACKAATDGEKLVELMSLTNGNKTLTKDQVKELRKQITARMAEVSVE